MPEHLCIPHGPTNAAMWWRVQLSPGTFLRVAIGFLLIGIFTGCGGPPPPERVEAPDVVGLIDSVDSNLSERTIHLKSGDVVELDVSNATDLWGPGIVAGRMLLYGRTDDHVWYASLSILETSQMPGCFGIGADAAFDEPDAVVFVFTEMRNTGIRIPKDNSFAVPSGEVSSDGRYAQGEVGAGLFCLNQDGLVFGMP